MPKIQEISEDQHKEFKIAATVLALCGMGIVAHHSLNVHADPTANSPSTAMSVSHNNIGNGDNAASAPNTQQAAQPSQPQPIHQSQNIQSAPNTDVTATQNDNTNENNIQNSNLSQNAGNQISQNRQTVQTPATTSADVNNDSNYTSTESYAASQQGVLQQVAKVQIPSNYASATSNSAGENNEYDSTKNLSGSNSNIKPLSLAKVPTNSLFYMKQSQNAPLVMAYKAVNVGNILGKPNVPKYTIATINPVGATDSGGFANTIHVHDSSNQGFANDYRDKGGTGGDNTLYMPSMSASGQNAGVYCNNYNLIGPQPGQDHTYKSTGSAPQKMIDALGYAFKHKYGQRAKALIVWATENGNTADQVDLSHVHPYNSSDNAEVQDARTALNNLSEGAQDAQELGVTAENYHVANGTGGQSEQDVTVVKEHQIPSKSKTCSCPPNNNNNNNNNAVGGGGAAAGGGSSSGNGGSPSGNGNSTNGGNGNGTNGGGNGTHGSGNGNNGGGNGSPGNNPNNSNNPNNGQPNNANPNNDNPNNVVIPDDDSGGGSSNNNNIVPNGDTVNNNDIGGNGSAINYNHDYSDLIAALINNEDRDNRDALDRLDSNTRFKESNAARDASAAASNSAANLSAAESGKNAAAIESMNASASIQAIDNSMSNDSVMNSIASSASSARDSYMDSINAADAAANSAAQNALDTIDHMPNLTSAERQKAFENIQKGENGFISDAIYGPAAANGDDASLDAYLRHIEAEVESENSATHAPSSSATPINFNPGSSNASNSANSSSSSNSNSSNSMPVEAEPGYSFVPPDVLAQDMSNTNDDNFDNIYIPTAHPHNNHLSGHHHIHVHAHARRIRDHAEYRAGYRAAAKGLVNHTMMEASPDYNSGYDTFQNGFYGGLTGNQSLSEPYSGSQLDDFNSAYSVGEAANGSTNTLPKTGEHGSASAKIAGAAAMTLGAMTLAGDELRKRKYVNRAKKLD